MPKPSTNRKYEWKVRDHLLANKFPMVIRAAASGQHSPDLVAISRSGTAILIEVKSLKHYTFRPTAHEDDKNQFDRYRQLAHDTGIVVFYAVCFKGQNAMYFYRPDYTSDGYPALSIDPAKTKRAMIYHATEGELRLKHPTEG